MMLGKFPKHEVLEGLDASAKLACHSDGVKVSKAIPISDMTAGDEERSDFLRELHDKERAGGQRQQHHRKRCKFFVAT